MDRVIWIDTEQCLEDDLHSDVTEYGPIESDHPLYPALIALLDQMTPNEGPGEPVSLCTGFKNRPGG